MSIAAHLLFLVLIAGIGGCNTTPSDALDLRTNPKLYRSTGYQAQAIVDRAAFIAPLVDSRDGRVVEANTAYPARYIPDDVWARPMQQMVEEIVVDELFDSGVFQQVRRSTPDPETLIVTPYLLVAQCGDEEHIDGRRSLAVLELRLVVHGPGASQNERSVLFDRTMREVVATPVERSPRPPMPMLGTALHKSLRKLLGLLDQSNVARSQVPSDPEISGLVPLGR